MIKFLAKGLLRDKSRSLFPILMVTIGASMAVLLYTYITGAFGQMINSTARFQTGHVKVLTRAFNEISNQIPNDLAIANLTELTKTLEQENPNMYFTPRIQFGGLLDIPDENGETKAQGPAFGLGLDLRSDKAVDVKLLNLKNGIVEGRLPEKAREILIARKYAEKLKVKVGENATLLGSTADGSMAVYNFIVSGLIEFGMPSMDDSAIIADISDIQLALNMPDGASHIVGFFNSNQYDDALASSISDKFNKTYSKESDEFSPIMLRLRDQNSMGPLLDIMNAFGAIFLFIFLGALSLVLWNTGLMGSIRRYGEIGLRLAIGESKGDVYRSLILEALLIGITGSIIGTIIGLVPSYWLQETGLNISNIVKGSNTGMLFPTIIRAKITTGALWIGFIPGVFASVLGTMFAGLGIYKRQTASLFKELEV